MRRYDLQTNNCMKRADALYKGKKILRSSEIFSIEIHKNDMEHKNMNNDGYKERSEKFLKDSVLAAYELVDKRIEEQIFAKNIKAICKNGCSLCCGDYFYVSKGECLVIKDFLRENSIEVTAIIENSKSQKENLFTYHKGEYERLLQNNAFDDFDDNRLGERLNECIFLKDAKCVIYPVRPIICRLHGVSRTYKVCEKIKKHCRVLFTSQISKTHLEKHTVNVQYDDSLRRNIDYIFGPNNEILLLKPYPLFWWFANDID